MNDIQTLHLAPLYSQVCEHVGDLTHRMAERYATHGGRGDFGYEFAGDKIEKTLRWLRSEYGFERETEESIVKNSIWRVNSDPTTYNANLQAYQAGDAAMVQVVEDARAALRELGQAYATAHRALPTFNALQRAAQAAAVAVGEWRFDDARLLLDRLQQVRRQGRDAWIAQASQLGDQQAVTAAADPMYDAVLLAIKEEATRAETSDSEAA